MTNEKPKSVLEKIKNLDIKVKGLIAAGIVVVLGLLFVSVDDNSKRVEELFQAQIQTEMQAFGLMSELMEIEITNLKCSKTSHKKAEYQAYKCSMSATMTEKMFGTTEEEIVEGILDYNPTKDELVGFFDA